MHIEAPEPTITDADAAADLAGTVRPDNQSAEVLARLQPHERRVIAERAELEGRLDLLTAFLATPKFESLTEIEQQLLVKQSGAMVALSDVLAERIALFKPA